ncbi:hypothetical protein N7462_002463 [Penicillium macrosclerotiorum]|uniref:uncharacterized protein n=1 Tax=Penicillium macrosclerotiorum TaxID=303699 RepID=UPI0025487916|nr:uncharacterized protein N7462_002463 [Penicillium macrosclerotiorum]KAJ5693040.1 hypothetical protein N7462_002463 [Penicillium macrosclerotiorum]
MALRGAWLPPAKVHQWLTGWIRSGTHLGQFTETFPNESDSPPQIWLDSVISLSLSRWREIEPQAPVDAIHYAATVPSTPSSLGTLGLEWARNQEVYGVLGAKRANILPFTHRLSLSPKAE